jgi:hypothetical protein
MSKVTCQGADMLRLYLLTTRFGNMQDVLQSMNIILEPYGVMTYVGDRLHLHPDLNKDHGPFTTLYKIKMFAETRPRLLEV